MKFGPQCFNDPFNYLDHDETVEEVDAYADIMLTGTDTNAIFAVSTFAHAVVVTTMAVQRSHFIVTRALFVRMRP